MNIVHPDAASEPTRAIAPRWLTQVDNAILFAVVVLTIVFCICVMTQVFMRYVMEEPLPWSEEVARYSFIWASFLTAAVIVGRNEHFAIEFVPHALPPRPRYALQMFTTLLCLVFSLVIVFYGANWSWRLLIATSPILELPQGAVYAIVPIAFLHMSIHLVVQFLRSFQEFQGAGAS